MTTAKYTVPTTADFTVVISRTAGAPHVALRFDEVSLNHAKDLSPASLFAAMRTALTAAFDAAVKKALTSNPHLAVADIAKVIDHTEHFLDSDNLPALIQVTQDPAPATTTIGRDPAISTDPVHGPAV